MTDLPDPLESYRKSVLNSVCGRLVAGAHRVRKRYRASFEDLDLSVEELVQHGALKTVECYEWMMANKLETYLSLPQADLERILVAYATQCMGWEIINVYRRRDRRRDAVAPEELLCDIDNAQMLRVALWRRIEPVMRSVTPRQRAIVQAMWDGLDTDEIRTGLGVSANVVRKDLAAVRSLAA